MNIKKSILINNRNLSKKEIHMSIVSDIEKLKKEKNAVILAHYYVDEDVQDIADYIGDSFYLSKVATKVDQDRIIFAGVEFMGESAKILNPDKRVFMPDMNADCPMAHMADKAEILKLRAEYDDLAVVCYINSTAELKKYSDVCVTSSNAVKIVKNLPNKNIFFIPDRNLGHFVAKQCPDKNFIPAPPEDSTCACNECNFMRLNTLEKLYNTLKYEWPEVQVDAEIARQAIKPIRRMLELSK